MTFEEKYINKIINGDSLTVMREMPDKCLDMVVTSPPYNLKNSTGNGMKDGRGGKWAGAALVNGYSHYDDNMPHEEYAEWQHNCLKEMFRLINVDRQDIVKDLPVRQIIIWKRKGGINFNPGYFLPTYEVIYLIPKNNFKLAPKANAFGDVWEFKQEMKNEHPAPFPVALIDRIISSTTAQTILDPFMGSGTTAVVAMGHKRNYIGIELSPTYCKMKYKLGVTLSFQMHNSTLRQGRAIRYNLFSHRTNANTEKRIFASIRNAA